LLRYGRLLFNYVKMWPCPRRDYRCGHLKSFAWLRKFHFQRMSFNPHVYPRANIVGGSLPEISVMNLRFWHGRAFEFHESTRDANVGTKLSLGSVAGEPTGSLHLSRSAGHFSTLIGHSQTSKEGDSNQPPLGPLDGCVPLWRLVIGVIGVVGGVIYALLDMPSSRLRKKGRRDLDSLQSP